MSTAPSTPLWRHPVSLVVCACLFFVLGVAFTRVSVGDASGSLVLVHARTDSGASLPSRRGNVFGLSPSEMHDSSFWCRSNPFLSLWNDASFTSAADALTASRLQSGLVSNSVRSIEADWRRFDASTPSMQTCSPMDKYPPNTANDDGGKFLCALKTLRAPCVIYSLGSHLEFDFEDQMVAHTPCEIHTFDCTVDISKLPALPSRVHFHHLCLGEDGVPDARYRSFGNLTTSLGHSEVALLKMDIEGYEFQVVDALIRGAATSSSRLPAQISFELHFEPVWMDVKLGDFSVGELALFWRQLADMGYAPISRENNKWCRFCTEFTVVRAFC